MIWVRFNRTSGVRFNAENAHEFVRVTVPEGKEIEVLERAAVEFGTPRTPEHEAKVEAKFRAAMEQRRLDALKARNA